MTLLSIFYIPRADKDAAKKSVMKNVLNKSLGVGEASVTTIKGRATNRLMPTNA